MIEMNDQGPGTRGARVQNPMGVCSVWRVRDPRATKAWAESVRQHYGGHDMDSTGYLVDLGSTSMSTTRDEIPTKVAAQRPLGASGALGASALTFWSLSSLGQVPKPAEAILEAADGG